MTVFLTPDGEPFYAGTYFPSEPRHGMPGFPQLLHAIAEAWREKRPDVTDQGLRIAQALRRSQGMGRSDEPLTEAILEQAVRVLSGSFDDRWGGFGGAPKFPQPMTLEFLLRMHLRGTPGAIEMVTRTLDRMADGGMHDQLGGGFHRYSVDGMWHVPHFEKMLYDNAQLARLYLHAWQVTGVERYRATVVKTLDYLSREMRHADGAFFASQDADSEGVEGKFFVWSHQELVRAAGNHGEAVAAYLGALPEGNWEGTNVLWTPRPVETVAADFGLPPDDLARAVEGALPDLLELRAQRVRPGTDDKVLAAWNGLAVTAFAEAGRALDEERYVEAATRAAGFVLERLRGEAGRLQRSWRDGRTSGPGFVDDHATMAAGCLELYRTTFDTRWMREARRLADDLIGLFHDEAGGGFYQTGSDATDLLMRPKELFDNAVPAGNSVAAEVLLKLSMCTGDAEYERLAVSALQAARDLLAKAPSAFGYALGALDLHLSKSKEIAIVGEPGAERDALIAAVRTRYLPNVVVAVAAPDDADAAAAVPLLAGRSAVGGRPAAYVCEGFVCRLPVTSPDDLEAQLGVR
jgi:uncharacterized protein YyaL (SSP411 family)